MKKQKWKWIVFLAILVFLCACLDDKDNGMDNMDNTDQASDLPEEEPGDDSAQWQTPMRISLEGAATESFSESERPIVGMDANGGGLAVWQQTGADSGIWAAHFQVYGDTETWSVPVEISGPGTDASDPSMAVNGPGEAVVIWKVWDSDSGESRLYSRFYKPADGWGAIIPLNTTGCTPSQVVLDDAGTATVGWERAKPHPTNPTRVKTAGVHCYVPGSGWSGEYLLEDLDYTDEYSYVKKPTLALGPRNTVHAVWMRELDDTYYVRYSVYEDSAWNGPESVMSTPDYIYPFMRMDIDSSGNVMIGLRKKGASGNPPEIRAIRYDSVSGWQSYESIIEAEGLSLPGLAVDDDSGSAVICWREDNDQNANMEDIRARHFTPQAGWGDPEFIETFDYLTAYDGYNDIESVPAAVALGNGNFLATWHQRGEESGAALYVNKYIAGQGWQDPEVFGDTQGIRSAWPVPAGDGEGRALMVWGQDNDETWAMSYR
ncbi:MAG: hypothetical protein ACLFNW_12195 [Desulfobacterales bacterium]